MASRWIPHARYRLYTSPASYRPRLTQPDLIEQFEAEICRRFGVRAAVCVPRARTGLFLTLLETLREGQKVIMSPLTIVDVVNAVLLAGGVPVFADVCRRSCAMDPGIAECLIDGGTGAVLITHLHGESADALRFRELCDRRGIRLIEDAAQAFGAIEGGRRLGTIGDAGIYSFGFFKNLCTWQGGMVVSNDRALIERIRTRVRRLPYLSYRGLLRNAISGLVVDVGTWPPVFAGLAYPVVSRNIGRLNRRLDPEASATRRNTLPDEWLGRMRPWQAALGLQQLDRVDADNDARVRHAERYHDALDGIPGIITPKRTTDLSNIYTYFPVQIPERDRALAYARHRRRDIAAQHLRNCADLRDFREFYRDCPNARAASSELILLPTYPRYPEEEIRRNIDVVKKLHT
jgi:dTDP-4-amino-4,6-dideoxygalactose transaminase